jgi:hypothetical protein
LDRFDVIGLIGLASIAAGVCALAGWPWCAVLVGAILVGLYAVREIRAIARG